MTTFSTHLRKGNRESLNAPLNHRCFSVLEARSSAAKRKSRNHLVEQVESFRIGDKDKKLENDLLDTFCYGIAIGLGNSEAFSSAGHSMSALA
jgi:hypothetical protein